MIAYIVTSGSYSDYSISSVFSSLEKAEAYIRKFRDESKNAFYDDYNVEQYEIDEDENVIKQDVWEYAFDAESGNAHPWRGVNHFVQEWKTEQIVNKFRSHVKSWSGSSYGKHVLVFISESTVSHEHAIKAAVEAHQLYLRTGIVPAEEFPA